MQTARDTSTHTPINRLLTRMLKPHADTALFSRVLAIQSTQLLAATADMPAGLSRSDRETQRV